MTTHEVHFFSLPKNEDANNADQIGFEILDESLSMLALADGVGKSLSGANAARIAISVVLEKFRTSNLETIFAAAQNEIAKAAASAESRNWSTTLTICLIKKGAVLVGHVGDSRLYHLRGKGLVTRTRDQTEVQALIDEGVISRERALKYPRRNVLVSALSSEISYVLYQESFAVEVGDRLLLLSDGVYKQLSRHEIAATSARNSDVKTFIAELKDQLLSMGLVDDSTALCWEIG